MLCNTLFLSLVLFNKLLEDGKFLLENGQVSEAQHRFEYALRKLSPDGDSGEEEAYNLGSPSQLDELRSQFLFEMLKCQTRNGVSELRIQPRDNVEASWLNFELYVTEIGRKFQDPIGISGDD